MLEALALNIVSGGLAKTAGLGVGKIRDVLRRKRFSEDVDALATEFNTALKNALEDALERDGRWKLDDLDTDWVTIAEELDDLEVVFESEEQAIVHITEAIGESLAIELDAHPALREALEAAVADAYQTSIHRFADRVAGTDLADVLTTETQIELTVTTNALEDRLTAIQLHLRRQDTAALRNVGITRLDPLYFERAPEPSDPDTAWRTGFDFTEIAADYPLARERPSQSEDNARQPLSDEILNRLDDGEDLVILGEGGSGKSTVCKQTAYRWHADHNRGPVFYRRSDATASINEPGDLIEAIRVVDEPVLVAVEDAADEDAAAIFEVLDAFEGESNVSFLLDSRDHAWRNPEAIMGNARLGHQHQRLGIVEMPVLDARECQRARDHYESLTGAGVSLSGDQLYEEVRTADIGGPLVLAYRLTGPATDTATDRQVSALHADVRAAYSEIDEWADGASLPQTVSVMVNVLNAAELPVESALIHALASDRDDHRTIERTLGFLEGTMLQVGDDGVRTPHQMWSALYLERLLEAEGKRLARDRFEQCVEAIFRLVDDERRREQVRNWLRNQSDTLTAISDEPDEQGGRFVRAISAIGEDRWRLGALHGSSETWQIALPAACSVDTERVWHNSWGVTHMERGALDAARSEFKQIIELFDSSPSRDDGETLFGRGIPLGNLGLVARKRGDLETAQEYHEESLEIKRDVGYRHGEATSLNNLGLVARKRGDFEAAQEYHEKSLEINRELGDRQGEASSLGNLGIVAQSRGDLEAAQEYHEKGLEIDREVGDRQGEASSLGNLGIVAQSRGDLEAAREYHEKSLEIDREVGDRQGEASSLNNLGLIARKRGDFKAAQEYHEESLEIIREVGDRHGEATSLNNLGLIAKSRGDLEAAQEYHEKSLEVNRDVGDRQGEALSLGNLGIVAQLQGDLKAAREYHEKSLEISREIGDRQSEASSLNNLGLIARKRGEGGPGIPRGKPRNRPRDW